MKIVKPMGEYLLVEAVLEDNLTASGIVLPDTGKEKPWSGKVLEIGPGKTLDNGTVQVIGDIQKGDLVFFAKYSPEELELDGKRYFLVKYSSIFAKGA